MNDMSEENMSLGGLAAIINSRLAAEARISRAIGFGWACGGLAVMCILSAIGLSIAFYGYSQVISVEPAAQNTVKAVVSAVERTKIKTTITGTVSLAPGSELKLIPNQTVKLA